MREVMMRAPPYSRYRVLYLSVHRYEDGTFWPNLRESNYDHTGSGAGTGYTCNVPLNATGAGNLDYLAVWTQLLLPLAYEVTRILLSVVVAVLWWWPCCGRVVVVAVLWCYCMYMPLHLSCIMTLEW